MKMSDPEYEVVGLTFRQKLALEWIIFKAWLKGLVKRHREDKCARCLWYSPESETCQLKKCAGFGYGHVTRLDRRTCDLHAPRLNAEAEWQHQ